MVDEILANIYKIEIPIHDISLGSLNSYVIRGLNRNLVIDTGLNQKVCINAMHAELRKLGVDIRETDFFITHFHPDHLGLVPTLVTDTTIIYFNQQEADMLKAGIHWDPNIEFGRLNGFPEDELKLALRTPHSFKSASNWDVNFHILKDGDTISAGDNLFRCIETPGHSRGHMCLYEPNKKIIFSGDHILPEISPVIQLWSDEWNPLKEYLESLEKVYKLDIELVLPGHRGILKNCKERILELKDHHEKRLDETVSILEEGSQNAFQVASQMSWDVGRHCWEMFPLRLKWLAVGEALAHLKYLEEEGRLRKEMREKKRIYSLSMDP